MQPDAAPALSRMGADSVIGKADFYLLQEVCQTLDGTNVADEIAARLGLYSYFTPAYPAGGCAQTGLAILSRYPLAGKQSIPLTHFNLGFRSRNRIAQTAVAATPGGPLRIYNVHLDTRLNLSERLQQLSPVLQHARRADSPTLIGGDFNTNPYLWVGRMLPLPFLGHQAEGVAQHMQKAGYKSSLKLGAATHDLFGMQLDWVFVRHIRVRQGEVHRMPISDHHALRVDFDDLSSAMLD